MATGDFAQIFPDSDGKKIKTFLANDSTIPDANEIETQAVVPVDPDGNWNQPLTEKTGLQILKVLISIDHKLAETTDSLPVDLGGSVESGD